MIHKLVSDNGKAFGNHLFAESERKASANPKFDYICQALGIDQGLTKAKTLGTNGMVDFLYGRIAEVPKTHWFSGDQSMQCTSMWSFKTATSCRPTPTENAD